MKAMIMVLSVLVFAPTAAADCAWVLWGKTFGDPMFDQKGWFIRASYDRRADCIKAYVTYVQDKRRTRWNVIGGEIPEEGTGQGALFTYPEKQGGLLKYQENLVCRPTGTPPTSALGLPRSR